MSGDLETTSLIFTPEEIQEAKRKDDELQKELERYRTETRKLKAACAARPRTRDTTSDIEIAKVIEAA